MITEKTLIIIGAVLVGIIGVIPYIIYFTRRKNGNKHKHS